MTVFLRRHGTIGVSGGPSGARPTVLEAGTLPTGRPTRRRTLRAHRRTQKDLAGVGSQHPPTRGRSFSNSYRSIEAASPTDPTVGAPGLGRDRMAGRPGPARREATSESTATAQSVRAHAGRRREGRSEVRGSWSKPPRGFLFACAKFRWGGIWVAPQPGAASAMRSWPLRHPKVEPNSTGLTAGWSCNG